MNETDLKPGRYYRPTEDAVRRYGWDLPMVGLEVGEVASVFAVNRKRQILKNEDVVPE